MSISEKLKSRLIGKTLLLVLDILGIHKTTRKIKTNLIIGLVITAVMAVLMTSEWGPLETLEDKFYDWRYKIRGPLKAPETVVIAAIDEKSLERMGRWPWSRDRLAELVEKLDQAGAAVIVFDIILSEAEKNDALLGKTIGEVGNVLMPVVFDFHQKAKPPENKVLVQAAFKSIANPERFNQYNPIGGKRVLLPVPLILQEAMALGHINMFPDRDGTLRWETLVVEYDGYLFPSIDLRAAAVFLGIPSDRMILKATEGIQLGAKRTIPTDRYGRLLIHYYGFEKSFPHISISDILEEKVDPKSLQGKIVLVGATAIGIYDLRVTPFSPAMAGIEKHANVIGSILENIMVRKSTFTLNLVILIASGLLCTLLIPRLKATGASITILSALLLILLSAYFLFVYWGLWVYSAYPSLTILFIYIGAMAYNYATEERYARRVRAMFSSYVTERVVNELIKNPDLARLGGDRREVTVLFSDVVGFTTFSEKNAPEQVVAILNEYLEAMTEVVFRWEGTLDKFIGDAIVAFWGAPLIQSNHAQLATCCALHMIKRLKELQEKWEKEGKPVLDCGIGINTGEVLVGNIGAEGKKMDYTVIGDHVNLGARLESLTRKYKAHILISEFTLNKIREAIASNALGHFSAVGMGRVIVKGKKLPVGIYELKSLEDHQACVLVECAEDQITQFDEK